MMTKLSVFNTFLDLRSESSISDKLKWLFNHWDKIDETSRGKFFYGSFLNFCKENKDCGENTIEILLAISVSSRFSEVDKNLKQFSTNCWAKFIREVFEKKILKIRKEITDEDVLELIKAVILLEINFFRSKQKKREIYYYLLNDNLFISFDCIGEFVSFGKETLNSLIEDIIQKGKILSQEINKFRLEVKREKYKLKVYVYYYK